MSTIRTQKKAEELESIIHKYQLRERVWESLKESEQKAIVLLCSRVYPNCSRISWNCCGSQSFFHTGDKAKNCPVIANTNAISKSLVESAHLKANSQFVIMPKLQVRPTENKTDNKSPILPAVFDFDESPQETGDNYLPTKITTPTHIVSPPVFQFNTTTLPTPFQPIKPANNTLSPHLQALFEENQAMKKQSDLLTSCRTGTLSTTAARAIGQQTTNTPVIQNVIGHVEEEESEEELQSQPDEQSTCMHQHYREGGNKSGKWRKCHYCDENLTLDDIDKFKSTKVSSIKKAANEQIKSLQANTDKTLNNNNNNNATKNTCSHSDTEDLRVGKNQYGHFKQCKKCFEKIFVKN